MGLSSLRRAGFVRSLVRRIGVHRVVAVVDLVRLPLLALVGVVVGRLPRDRRLVVLGSPLDRFADNAAHHCRIDEGAHDHGENSGANDREPQRAA